MLLLLKSMFSLRRHKWPKPILDILLGLFGIPNLNQWFETEILLMVSFNSNTMCVTSRVGTVNSTWTLEFTTGFNEARVAYSLLFCVVFFFADHCLSFCLFYCVHCIDYPSIFDFWLPHWYSQTCLKIYV